MPYAPEGATGTKKKKKKKKESSIRGLHGDCT
jgi:hypothetical protein